MVVLPVCRRHARIVFARVVVSVRRLSSISRRHCVRVGVRKKVDPVGGIAVRRLFPVYRIIVNVSRGGLVGMMPEPFCLSTLHEVYRQR